MQYYVELYKKLSFLNIIVLFYSMFCNIWELQSFHILANICGCHFLILDNLVGMKSYLLLILICTLLITNDAELFMCVLAIGIYIYLLRTVSVFGHFKIELFLSIWLICRYTSYILNSSPFRIIYIATLFSQPGTCYFTFWIVYIYEKLG